MSALFSTTEGIVCAKPSVDHAINYIIHKTFDKLS